MVMGSGLRRWLLDPVRTLQGADLRPGQTVLEVGCGTGFFTVPAAQLIGDQGCLLAMDVVAGFLEQVSAKVRDAGLTNVRVLKRDALETGFDSESIDRVLLLGVVPFPSLPLNRLLPEIHRVLKPDGSLAVWQFPVSGWVPRSIARSGLFTYIDRRNGVYRYKPC
jgi:demethylmenaquinone methyltransferase/2-methoxy-6-polyprenyl-1,4-benzoquinol methylase